MDTCRKIQLSAAAVVANGLMALGTMSPNVAHANPCAPKYTATDAGCGDVEIVCNFQAPPDPGCTFTSGTCWPGPNMGVYECRYD